MRVPAAHRAMGRSIAGKRPVGNSGRDRRGRIKPNRTPNKSDPRRPSTTSTSTTSATTSTTNKQTKPTRERSRAQEVKRLRPAGVHTQWGAPGDVDGKMAGQSHILQFATAAAVCACLFLVSGAGLASVQGGSTTTTTTTTSSTTSTSTSTKSGSGVTAAAAAAAAAADNAATATLLSDWLFAKTASTAFISFVACGLRSYWVFTNYTGSSKLTSFSILMSMDWIFGLIIMIVMLFNYVENGFWWLGFATLLIFTLASLRTFFDIVYSAIRKSKEKKKFTKDRKNEEEKKNEEKKKNEEEKNEKGDDYNEESPRSINVVVVADDAEPSAPPIHYDDDDDDENAPPKAPVSPVKSDRMMKRGSGTTANERGEAGGAGGAGGEDGGDGSRLRPGEVMNQRMFEDRWLRLPQLSSRNDIFLPPVTAMSDIKLHFKEREFDVVASGQ